MANFNHVIAVFHLSIHPSAHPNTDFTYFCLWYETVNIKKRQAIFQQGTKARRHIFWTIGGGMHPTLTLSQRLMTRWKRAPRYSISDLSCSTSSQQWAHLSNVHNIQPSVCHRTGDGGSMMDWKADSFLNAWGWGDRFSSIYARNHLLTITFELFPMQLNRQ